MSSNRLLKIIRFSMIFFCVLFTWGVFSSVPSARAQAAAEPAVSISFFSSKPRLELTASDASFVYDGEPHALIATVDVTDGTTLSYSTDNGRTWSTEAPAFTDVGQYKVRIKAEHPDMRTAKARVTLSITPRPVTLTPENTEKTYGQPDPEVPVAADGLLGDDTVTYEVKRDAGEDAGVRAVFLKADARQGNYEVSTGTAALTIHPTTYDAAGYSIAALFADKIYDGTPLTGGVVARKIDGTSLSEKTSLSDDAALPEGAVVSYSLDGGETWETEAPTLTDAGTLTYLVRVEHQNYETLMASGTLHVQRRLLLLTSASDSKAYDGAPLTQPAVTVEGDGFADGEGASFEVTGSRTDPGIDLNSFTYKFDENTNAGNYEAATVFGMLQVQNPDAAYKVTVHGADSIQTYDGTLHTADGLAAETFDIDGHTYQILGLTATAHQVHAGSYPIPISGTPQVLDEDGEDVTDQFDIACQPGTLTIQKRSLVLRSAFAVQTTTEAVLHTHGVQNGGVLAEQGTFARGDGFAATATGTQWGAGSADNTFAYVLTGDALARDYDIAVSYGKLIVTGGSRISIRVTARSLTEIYDGTEHEVSGISGTKFVYDGAVYTIEGLEAQAVRVHAGSESVPITGTPVVRDADGKIVTRLFDIVLVPGTLTVLPRQITLASTSVTRQDDGDALTSDTVVLSGEGLAEGDDFDIETTGVQTGVGSSENTFVYEAAEDTLLSDYQIKTAFGRLELLDPAGRFPITLTPYSETVIYDGQPHPLAGFVSNAVEVFGSVYTVEGLRAEAQGIDAGTYPMTISGEAVVYDGAGNDVTDQFSVHVESGNLTILPRSVLLTSASAQQEYDGETLANDEVLIGGDGFAEDEGADWEVRGAQTAVGRSANEFDYVLWDNTLADNYQISVIYGDLCVTGPDTVYTVEVPAQDQTVTANGRLQTVRTPIEQTVTVDGTAYRISGLVASASALYPGSYPMNVEGTARVTDENGNDVSDAFMVNVRTGMLTVLPVEETDTAAEAAASDDAQVLWAVTVSAQDVSVLYDGQPHESAGLRGTQFTAGGRHYQVTGLSAKGSGTNAGSYEITVEGTPVVLDEDGNDVTAQFEITTASGTLTINPRQVTLISASAEREEDAAALTCNTVYIAGDGFASGEGVALTVTGSQATPGSSANTFTYAPEAGTDLANYQITTEEGTLYVGDRAKAHRITVTAASRSTLYDGTAQTVSGLVQTTFEIDGMTYTVEGLTAEAAATDAGTYPVAVTGTPVVKNRRGKDVTSQFVVLREAGTLTIEKRSVILISGDASRPYNGRALTEAAVTDALEGFAPGEGAACQTTGSRIIPGTSENTFTYTLNENTKAENYNIIPVYGTLTVTDRPIRYPVVVMANSDTCIFDGTSHRVSGLTGTSFTADGITYTITGLTASGRGIRPGSYPVEVNGTPVVQDPTGNDVTAQFDIRIIPGTLTIVEETAVVEGTENVAGSEDAVGSEHEAASDDFDASLETFAFTITAPDREETYRGSDYIIRESLDQTIEIDGRRYLLRGLTAEATARDAGTYEIEITGDAHITDADGADVTGQFDLTLVPGQLVIAPAPVEVQALSVGKTEGENDPQLLATVSGTMPGERSAISYELVRDEGEEPGTYAIYAEGDRDQGNYEVTFVNADFTVVPSNVLALFANDVDVIYDGTVHRIAVQASVKNQTTLSYSTDGGETWKKQAPTLTDVGTMTVQILAQNPQYADAQIQVRMTVRPRPVTVSARDARKTYGAADPAFAADVTGVVAGEEDQITYTLSRESGESAGIYMLRAFAETSQGNYHVTTRAGEFTIAQDDMSISAVNVDRPYDGNPATGGVLGTPEGATILYRVAGSDTFSQEPPSLTNVGTLTYTVIAFHPDCVTTQAEGTLTVQKRQLELISKSEEKEYDGDPLTAHDVDVQGDGFAAGDGADYTFYDSLLYPGTTENTFDFTLNPGTDPRNYDIDVQYGTLTVSDRSKPFEVEIKASDHTAMYNGEPQEAEGLETDEVQASGHSYTVTGLSAYAEEVHAGSYEIPITGEPVVLDADGVDVTAQFSVKTTPGTLTIEPRHVTLVSADALKYYDGLPLTTLDEVYYGISIDGDGFVEEDAVSCEVTGTQTIPGKTENTFEYTLNEDVEASDYQIDTEFGTLTVTSRPEENRIPIELQAADGERIYNGKVQTFDGLDASHFTWLEQEYTVEGLKAEARGTDVGLYPTETAGKAVVRDADGNDVSDQFEITVLPGQLEILPGEAGDAETDAAETDDDNLETIDDQYPPEGILRNEDPPAEDTQAENTETAAEDEPAGDETVDNKSAEDESAEDETTSDETAEDETTSDETAEDETTSDETASDETASDETTEDEPAEDKPAKDEAAEGKTLETEEDEAESSGGVEIITGTSGDTLRVINGGRSAIYEITVNAASGRFVYDGTEHTVSGLLTESFTIGSYHYYVNGLTAQAAATDAGTYRVEITGDPVVRDAAGNDVTSRFAVRCIPGELVIEKRKVTLTSASAQQQYNGSPLAAAQVEIGGDGFAEGEGADFEVTGAQTEVGLTENTFTYTLQEGTNPDNYEITLVPGTLTVTSAGARQTITVQAKSDQVLYDGTEHSVEGLLEDTFVINGQTYTVSGLTAQASAIHAGEVPVPVIGTPFVKDEQGNDVTAQFTITAVPGTLTILPRKVRLDSAAAEHVNDGEPVNALQIQVSGDGFAPGDGVTVEMIGERLLPGSSENRFAVTCKESTQAGDYEIQSSYGVLTVLHSPQTARYEVTVTGESGTIAYDGMEHSFGGIRGDTFIIRDKTYTITGLRGFATATTPGRYPVNVTGNPVVTDPDGNDVTDQFVIHTLPGTLTIQSSAASASDGAGTTEQGGSAGTNANAGANANAGTNTGSSSGSSGVRAFFRGLLERLHLVKPAKQPITVVAASGDFLYNGEEHAVEGIEGLQVTIDGAEYEITGLTAHGSGTDAGTYPVRITGTAVVLDADGNDVSDQYEVQTISGTLTIHPRQVTLRSADLSVQYDGKTHLGGKITVEGDGFIDGEGVDTATTCSRTLIGVSTNSFTWSLQQGTEERNYEIQTVYGYLSVTNPDARYLITLAANTSEVQYDGAEHEVTGFVSKKIEINSDSYTEKGLYAKAYGTEPGWYPSEISGAPYVLDADGNDVTDQFAVQVKGGGLTIQE